MSLTTPHQWPVSGVKGTPHWLRPFLPGKPVAIRLMGGISRFSEDSDLQDADGVEIETAKGGGTIIIVLGFSFSETLLTGLIVVGSWGHLQVSSR